MTSTRSPRPANSPRVVVVYESMFGNTREVAEILGRGLEDAGAAVELRDVRSAPRAAELVADLVVLGAPTHAFSLSRPSTRADAVRQGAPGGGEDIGVREWLQEALGSPPATRIPLIAFDTRVNKVRHLPGSAARKASRLARTAGFTLLAGPESFYVDDVQGPLSTGEQQRAAAWAHDVLALVPQRRAS